jgi:hypothetical protein
VDRAELTDGAGLDAQLYRRAVCSAVDLYLAPPGRAQDAPAISTTPLIASKRGRRGSGDYPGVDGQVQTDAFDVDASIDSGGERVGAPTLPLPTPPAMIRGEQSSPAPHAIASGAVRVAVIDIAFDRLGALPAPAEGPIPVGLPADDAPATTASTIASWGPGHGTAMAAIVQVQCPGARRLFQIPSSAGAARLIWPGADPRRVATAVDAWQADVVLLAMTTARGDTALSRDVRRRRRAAGAGGARPSSVGRRSVEEPFADDDSVSLGADDLASQPGFTPSRLRPARPLVSSLSRV